LKRACLRPGHAVATALAMLLSIALAACGAKDSDVAKEPGAEAKPAQQGANELHLYNWNNYIAEDTVKRFEAFCKCRLVQDYYSDNEELLAKLAAGATGYDVLVPTGNAVETLIAGGALRGLDKAKLPNIKNVKPEFANPWYEPGNKYSVPYAYSITLIGYNNEKMKELGLPTDTWAVIFDPKYLDKIKGKVTVLDSQRELFAAALIYLGYPANETDPVKLKQARDTILLAKPYWAAFNASSYIKELTIGNIWLAHGYSNDMFQAAQDAAKAKRSFSIGYSTPKQCADLALGNMVMHKTGPGEALGHQFINFMLEGKNSAELSNMLGSGNPNAAAMPFIDPEVKDNPAVFPDAAAMKRLEQLRDLPRKERRLMNRMWTEIKVR